MKKLFSKNGMIIMFCIMIFMLVIAFCKNFLFKSEQESMQQEETTITNVSIPEPNLTITVPITENEIISMCSLEDESEEVKEETSKEYNKEKETEKSKETKKESVEEIVETTSEEESGSKEEESDEPDMELLGNYYVTGYCTESCCNSSENAHKTASGEPLTPWYVCAMKGIEFGTKIYVDGLGEFTVLDRGVGYEHVDICVNSHSEANDITGYYDVYIMK